MTTKDEALKLALEPVMSVYITKDGIEDWWHKLPEGRYELCDLVAIREALASKSKALMSVPDGSQSRSDEQQPAQPKGCQCPACKVTPHASDCAVHNEPAYQKGSCDCGAQQWNAGVPSLYPEPELGVSINATYEQPAQQEQWDSNCQDDDGCPAEMAVLQRFWRGQPIPTQHYPSWFKPAQQQEPVAWVCEASSSDEKHAIDYWPGDMDDLPVGTKLYTSPPASKPLTDEQIRCLTGNAGTLMQEYAIKVARAIEAAHGIMSVPDGKGDV